MYFIPSKIITKGNKYKLVLERSLLRFNFFPIKKFIISNILNNKNIPKHTI